jgi:hypothetical protein
MPHLFLGDTKTDLVFHLRCNQTLKPLTRTFISCQLVKLLKKSRFYQESVVYFLVKI